MEFNLPNQKNRSSNRFPVSDKLRLVTLVAALGLVLWAMNEASKPETWERLGFVSSSGVAHDKNADPAGDNVPPTQNDERDSQPPPAIEQNPGSSNFDLFWNRQISALDQTEKQKLADILQAALVKSKPSAAEKMSTILRRGPKRFLDEHQNIPSDDVTTLEQSIETIIQGDIENATGRSNLLRVQSLLDDHAYSQVEDRTTLNRSVESLAWNRTWQRMFEDQADSTFKHASYLQLSGQPHAYRGKQISIRGVVRGAETIALAQDHKLGLDAYKVLWIKPETSNRTPYCVYVRDLPSGFPDPGNQFLKLNEDVAVDGIFFKLRTYQATNNQVEICPLIVADTIQWRPKPQQVVATNRWQPPTWLLMLFFVGMPIVATGMAYGVYRSTQTLRRNLDERQQDVEQALGQLAENKDLKSDRERLQELAESEKRENL